MKKIYLSPSSQPANKYAVGNTNEQEQWRKISAALDVILERCGFDSKAGLSGTMYTRVAESNAWGANLHMPIHTNAFDGKVAGLRIMIFKNGGEAEKIAKAIMATLAPITPGTSDGISVQPKLYEISDSNAICVYVEVGFHDNPTEARWIIDHTEDIAEAIAKGLCNHYGVKYVYGNTQTQQPAEKPVATENIYRVFNAAGKQVGAYSVEANALNEVKKQLNNGGGAKITYGPK
jgi:N-acetylmuramoyl-L-alanine amidase